MVEEDVLEYEQKIFNGFLNLNYRNGDAWLTKKPGKNTVNIISYKYAITVNIPKRMKTKELVDEIFIPKEKVTGDMIANL